MATKNFNVNSLGYSQVVLVSDCTEVTVGEDNQAGTTDYYVSGTGNDSDKITKPAGSQKTFKGNFRAGQTAGWVKTVTGSVTFSQEENGGLVANSNSTTILNFTSR